MFVERAGEHFPVYSQKVTVENYRKILSLCGFCREDVTSITLDAPTNLSSGIGAAVSDTDFANEDDKYEQAKEIVLQTGKTSVSNIQVRLGTGYARSAKLINMLEQAGVIITVTDNSGKKVKAVHSRLGNDVEQGRDDNQQDTQSNTREDILKIEENPGMSDLETAQDTQPKEKQNSFFRF